MNNHQNIRHPKGYIALSLSKSLERVSYYGIRGLMVLYLTGEVMNMERAEALEFYGWFSMLILVIGIIGALIGDLIIGNRKAIIFGAVFQLIGAFTLCVPNDFGLYTGFALFLIGNGLYVPNFNSNFGKQYLDRTKLLDSGFIILFIAISIGALLGPLILGYAGEFNFKYGFIGAGISILLSLMFFLSVKSNFESSQLDNITLVNVNFKLIIIALSFLGIYWGLYEVSNFSIFEIQQKIGSKIDLEILSLTRVSSSSLLLPFGIIAAIIWSKKYSSQFSKLTVGLIFTLVSFGLLYLIPQDLSEVHFIIFFISMVFLGVAEIFITPVLFSVLTQYANPKYLTIVMSIAFIPRSIFIALLMIYSEQFFHQPKLALTVAIIGVGSITIALVMILKKLSTTAIKNGFN